jgi:YVTN family beta-propeller protein
VANGHGNSVTIIDAKAWKVAAIIPVGRRPWGVALSADGRKLYTANGVSNDVSVVDTAARRVVKVIAAGEGPWDVAVAR